MGSPRKPRKKISAQAEQFALSPDDLAWSRRFERASRLLLFPSPADAPWVKTRQKFVPCSRRGTHHSLNECCLCAGDVLRGDATLTEVLLPGDARDVFADRGAPPNADDALPAGESGRGRRRTQPEAGA